MNTEVLLALQKKCRRYQRYSHTDRRMSDSVSRFAIRLYSVANKEVMVSADLASILLSDSEKSLRKLSPVATPFAK